MINNKKILALAMVLSVALMGILSVVFIQPLDATTDYISHGDVGDEALKFFKNIGVWFMLMMVAFLMIFIKKFEWGVCLAVLLSAASSYLVYCGIHEFWPYYDEAIFATEWGQDLMLGAVICAITYVIAIGVFLGTVKQWQYFLGGIAFAVVYCAVEWMVLSFEIMDTTALDTGGSIMVHMCAAYFGLGVCLALRVKEAFNEPMNVTTHSVSFVWLASMVLWVLWPTFVCAFLPADQFMWGIMTCYMAGIGSVVSAYVVCMVCQKKVNPLTYTYAMLAGPVAIGAPLVLIGPWVALIVGIIAGIVSALCFIYLQPKLCGKLGVLDVMGVHNLHGMAGWTGAILCTILILVCGESTAAPFDDATAKAVATIAMAVIVFAISLVGGFITGIIMKLTKGKEMEMFSDDYDFIRTECPDEIAKL
ncbi:MAG: ammonium transporter [Thermoplasmata archaeon]|nr:ammonium transporter [Thermoplasmata archaeon]